MFTQKVYKATLTENAAMGVKLTTVSATDADEGSNGHVRTTLQAKTILCEICLVLISIVAM